MQSFFYSRSRVFFKISIEPVYFELCKWVVTCDSTQFSLFKLISQPNWLLFHVHLSSCIYFPPSRRKGLLKQIKEGKKFSRSQKLKRKRRNNKVCCRHFCLLEQSRLHDNYIPDDIFKSSPLSSQSIQLRRATSKEERLIP